MIEGILDNDLYKFTMQQAVIQKFPWAEVGYKFYNRDGREFPKGFAKQLRNEVDKMQNLWLKLDEAVFLTKTCGKFLSPAYIDFLAGYRFNPEEVQIDQDGSKLDVRIEGPWYRTILWEVPLMAMISEQYFSLTGPEFDANDERDLDQSLEVKAQKLDGIWFADFGTRRRYSKQVHELVVQKLKSCSHDFVGTSNVLLAMKNDLKPIGTQAHEWFMFHGAKYGYRHANSLSMKNWFEVYNGHLGIALTDTYTTQVFFDSFDTHMAKLYDGVRHDSGSPAVFASKVIRHYEKLGIDPATKTIVFSDGLHPDEVRSIEAGVAYTARRIGLTIKTSYGIGTNLTNDVGADPLNIVIKLDKVRAWPAWNDKWTPAIKLSDVPGKHTGDPDEIDLCKKELGL